VRYAHTGSVCAIMTHRIFAREIVVSSTIKTFAEKFTFLDERQPVGILHTCQKKAGHCVQFRL
jgi:hypothetical protein